MKRRELKNKPLIEAIFELKWDLNRFENKVDPHYRILTGSIFEKVRSEYPFSESLPTAEMPDVVSGYIIQHRFRKEKAGWPLIQIGPGILTLNDTQGYKWESFEYSISQLIENFLDAYTEKEKLSFCEVTLRYIDAVEFDYENKDILDFLKSKMKINIEIHENLFSKTGVKNSPQEFDLKLFFPVDSIQGIIHSRFRRGSINNKDALVWETMTQSKLESNLNNKDSIMKWLKKAHELTDGWFFEMIEGDLIRKFE